MYSREHTQVHPKFSVLITKGINESNNLFMEDSKRGIHMKHINCLYDRVIDIIDNRHQK